MIKIFTYTLSPLILIVISIIKPNAQPLIIAHRGASAYAPENTLASINKALEIGVDIIEVDVHLTADEELVVIHDKNLKRTTGLNKRIKDCTLREIKSLSAGKWFGKNFENEKIPTLEEVIRLVNNRCKLLIEIKEGNSFYPNIEQKVLTLIKELNAENFCLMHTFAQAAVYTWHSFNSQVPVSYLKVGGPIKIWTNKLMHAHRAPDSVNCYSNNYYYRFVTKRFVKRIHCNKQKIFVWTVNKPRAMRRLVKAGVDGIITNKPLELKQVIEKINNGKTTTGHY